MVTDSFFAVACGGLIALIFGMVLAFAGYRFFIILLPIWGFFFGLVFGAQAIQALLGTGFLATVTSWVVGFVVGAVFAILSYLFYAVAVAVIAGSLGYSLAVGLLLAIGLNMNFLVWVIGVVTGIALAVVTIFFNLQKWVVIVATALLGAGVIVGTFVLMFNPAAQVMENPVRAALDTSTLLLIVAIVVAVAGIFVQVRSANRYKLEAYSNW